MTPLERLCERHNIKIESKYGGAEVPAGWTAGTVGWKVTLRMDGRQFTTNYFTGPAIEREPTAADVLYCLVSDARVADMGSFEDFCSEFGYDTDSRKAERIYNECKKMAPKLATFLGTHYYEFCNAEH